MRTFCCPNVCVSMLCKTQKSGHILAPGTLGWKISTIARSTINSLQAAETQGIIVMVVVCQERNANVRYVLRRKVTQRLPDYQPRNFDRDDKITHNIKH